VPIKENAMSETTQNATTTATKPTKRKAAKKPAKAKAATPKTKTPKAAKPKKEKAPKEDLMTFAFRMTKAESVALHKAAGPANASRTMRALASAFVAEDRAAFETVVEDAKKLR
jgi:hypothetical protein